MGRKPKTETNGKKPLRKSKLNSAITNHTRLFLPGVNESGAVARLVRDNLNLVLADLGGIEQTSKMEQSLARRVAALDAVCVKLEASFVEKGEMDVALYTTAANALNRIANSLGLARRPRDVHAFA